MGTERCNFCAALMETKDLRRCANCKIAFYCSRECQKLHWKMAHKAFCMLQVTQGNGEHPEEKAQVRTLNRWINAWSAAMTECSSIALDLANHPWGRHETHTLYMTIEHTNLKEDARLFKITEASIQSYADVVKRFPQVETMVASLPGCSEWPRLHCFVFVKDRCDPTQMERGRIHSCCIPNLKELRSHWSKDYSREVSKQAIPLLLGEINGLKNPEVAARRFRLMTDRPDVVQICLDMLKTGFLHGSDEELFQEWIERLVNEDSEETNHV